MSPAPLSTVRLFTTLITSAVWWLLLYGAGWVFSGGGKVTHVTPEVMGNLTGLSYVFIPYFATEGVLVSMLGTLMKKKVVLPESPADPNARPANPWLLGAINALIFGVVPGGIGYWLAGHAAADTFTPNAFAVRYALGGSLVCAITAWYVSGTPFLKQTRVASANRLFTGDPKQYLLTRFALPHGIANFLINGPLAYALAPVAPAGTLVENKVVIGDAVITFAVLTWIIASGVKGLASAEAQWGIAPESAIADLSMPAAFLPAFFAGVGFATVLGVSFWIFDVNGMSVTTWAVFRAVVFGVYCGWCAQRCAQAAINETFHPEAAAPSGRRAVT